MKRTLLSKSIFAMILAFTASACNGSSASGSNGDSVATDCVATVVEEEDETDAAAPSDTVRHLYHIALMGSDGKIIVGNPPSGKSFIPDEWGVIDRTGKVIVDPDEVSLIPGSDKLGYMVFMSPEGYVAFRKKGGGCGVFNSDYKEVIKGGTYEEITLYGNYAVARKKGDSRQIVVSLPSGAVLGYLDGKYTVAGISDGMVRASFQEKGAYLIEFLYVSGKVAVPAAKLKDYSVNNDFSQGLAAVTDRKNQSTVGYIDKKGNLVIPFRYGDLAEAFDYGDSSFNRLGVAFVSDNGKVGAIDKRGKVVIPFKYDSLKLTDKGIVGYKWNNEKDRNDIFAVKVGGNAKAVDESYLHSSDSTPYLKPYWDKTTGLNGYEDDKGRVVITPKYTYCYGFEKGIAIVGDATGRHLIDSSGRILIRNLAKCSYEMLPG